MNGIEVFKLIDFAALLLSIILFIEVLIVCKRPIVLKRILLAITCGYILLNFALFIQHYTNHIRGATETPIALLTILSICLFSYLSVLKIDKLALGIGIFIFISQLLAFFYFNLNPKFAIKLSLSNPSDHRKLLIFIRFAVFMTGIFLLNWYYFLKLLKNYNDENIYYAQLRSWAYWFIGIFTMSWVINFLFVFTPINIFWVDLAKKLCHFAFVVAIFYRPKFLNHSNYNVVLDGPYLKYKAAITQDEFLHIFFTSMFYLKENANLEDFSAENNLLPDDVTEYIFNQYSLSFNELMNKARVDYFISLVESGKYADLNMTGIAVMAGFSSRQHLSKWFKKFHGGNPSDIM